ncbi:MAG: hypothetical protein GY807_16075 [Gammaproteobacteria bacterium]|nr:hypothetical protein [Gammaproteobacteria bacterium]
MKQFRWLSILLLVMIASPLTAQEQYHLSVVTEPEDARVRIMNIAPHYYPGIRLSPGSYLLRVEQVGYQGFERWVRILDHDLTVHIALRSVTPSRSIDEAGSGRRVALVIGNGNYDLAPLRNPVNDAQDIAATLRRLGFDIILSKDADLKAMEDAIRRFAVQLRRAEIGLFYYAGHGVQVKGGNYLIPVGSDIQAEDEVRYKSVDAQFIVDKMQSSGNSMNIIILDSCRDNPFARSFRSSNRGLASMDATRGSIIAYATKPGGVASDGSGRNSVYTKHLLRNILISGLSIERFFKQVRIAVLGETDGQQVPWESSSLTNDFYFAESVAIAPQMPTDAPAKGAIKSEGKTPIASLGEKTPSKNGVNSRSKLKTKNTSTLVGDGRWDWTVFIDADKETLKRIQCVEYTLHKTFPNPVRKRCNMQDRFALNTNGWGTFRIKVKALFKDGTEKLLFHDLVFQR